jgi:hypothetical protein
MPVRWRVVVFWILFSVCPMFAQSRYIGTCAAFASNGDLLFGAIRDGEFKLHVHPAGQSLIRISEKVDASYHPCEISFSPDGKWAAVAVAGSEITVFVLDRATNTIFTRFSSQWLGRNGISYELQQGNFLGGFDKNDSIVLWNYASQSNAGFTTDDVTIDLHRQLWSIDGKRISDQYVSLPGWRAWRWFIQKYDGETVWLPASCKMTCYENYQKLSIRGDDMQNEGTLAIRDALAITPVFLPSRDLLLAIAGTQTSAQSALLFDSSGHIVDKARLPFLPNPLRPVVPDWFGVSKLKVSADGEIAAVARTRTAWVLTDTDRDWGSEIILLRTQPLSVLRRYKTGRGGIGSIAVDQRNGVIRVVGYWRHGWNDLRCDEFGKCRAGAL